MWTVRMRGNPMSLHRFPKSLTLDNAVDSAGNAVHQSVMPWISPSTVRRSLGSSCSSTWILSTACSTVV